MNRFLRRKLSRFINKLKRYLTVNAGRITTTELVNRIFIFCELYSNKKLFPYQEQFSKRVIRSVLENDGEEITALFSRQSGKSETISVTSGGMMIILPLLANMPMFADDPRLSLFKDGLWIGIFAPSQRQASITYNRIKSRIQCPTAIAVLESPEFNLEFTTSNGQTVKLSNGSFATAISASEGSNIEGESFKLIICEECFVRGTKVLTLNGEKPIEEVKVGDFVYSYNHNTRSIELKPVVRSFSQPLYGRKLVTIRSKSGRSFTCTDNHPVYIEGKGYTRADNLHIGDLMLSCTYATQGGICNGFKSDDLMQGFIQERVLQELLSKDEIREIEIREVSEVEVFDLTVEDNHNFFAEGCLVHNCQDISNFKIRKCLTGDTKVLLADGTYKRIDSIVSDKKDDVVTFNPSMEYLTTNSPSEFYDNGIQEVYELSLDNGSSIKATLNHQFYTYDQKTRGKKCSFRTLQQIKDSLNNERPLRVGIPDRLPYFSNEGTPTDYNKGLLLGYFLGDGCLVGTPKFIGDIPTCDRLLEVIRSNVSDKVSMTEYHYNPENGMQEVCFSTPTNKKGSNPLTSMFKEFGVYGLTGDSKKLQNVLYSKSFYKGFVEGLIETDGSIECCATKPVISFANISKELVLQLKDILHRFGIHSTLFCKNNDKGFGSDSSKPLWVLNIKSVCDINRFNEEFVLYRKQVYLNEAVNTISGKEDREHSKYYSDQMRFCRVKSIKYVGLEPTYCLKVKGRNFIANGMISSNSIHPMGAAYNASIIKIGTATTFKGDFYEAIQRNKREAEIRSTHRKNHFEYDYTVASKYNPSYAKYVEKEKRRLGENSDEFRMAYKLEWVIERGMFVDITKFEENNVEPLLERSFYDKNATHVVGIDLGGKGDDTVVTVVEVCWNVPAILESTINPETNEEEVYQAYNCYIKDWFRISNEPDYEVQYALIVDYLSHFNISKVLCDATREAGLSHRLRANMPFEVIPYIFTTKSKSELYKHLDREITSGRARVPGGKQTIESPEYKDFLTQLGDLQKGYSGVNLVVSHPDEKGAHDDFPDSWALAVFGCSEPGTVNTVQTSNSPFNKYGKKDSHRALQQCNRVRARRRR